MIFSGETPPTNWKPIPTRKTVKKTDARIPAGENMTRSVYSLPVSLIACWTNLDELSEVICAVDSVIFLIFLIRYTRTAVATREIPKSLKIK